MKTKRKKTRISLFVIDNHGVKHPCHWQDGWVISDDTSTDEWAFFARVTPPKPGQVIGYRSGRFSPTPNTVADYIMCRVDTKGRRWQVEDICAVVDNMFGHFLEHCARAREAVAARPDRHPLDIVTGNPELCGLWALFALKEQKLLDAFVERVRNGLTEDKKIDCAG